MKLRFLVVVVLAQMFALSSNTTSFAQDAALLRKPCYDDSLYDNFVVRFGSPAMGNTRHPPGLPLQLTVTWLEGTEVPSCGRGTSDAIYVSTTGKAYTVFQGESAGSGELIDLPEETKDRLEQFLRNVPDDGHKLPPRGDRVVLRALVNGAVVVRVFDRSNLPDQLIELIRVTDSRIEVAVPALPPTRVWSQEEIGSDAKTRGTLRAADAVHDLGFEPDQSLTESADGTLVATRSLIYDGTEIRVYRAIQEEPVFKTLIPPVGRKWVELTYMAFNPDASVLLVEMDGSEIRAYETKAWTQTNASRIVAPNAVEYFPSRNWKCGVSVDASGAAELWDASAHRAIGALAVKGKVRTATFSPSSNLLAVTSSDSAYRAGQLSIVDARNGRLLRVVWPVKWRASVMGIPAWWHGDEYLVAPIRGFVGPGTVGVWNTSTGRLVRTLSGCGMAGVIVEHDEVFQHCADGRVLQWRLDGLAQ